MPGSARTRPPTPPKVPPISFSSYFPLAKRSLSILENLKKANITGDKNIGHITDGVAEGVGGQFSSGGLLGVVGDTSSKEGVNRAERAQGGDYGELDQGKKKAEEGQKGWGNTLSGGMLGGGKK